MTNHRARAAVTHLMTGVVRLALFCNPTLYPIMTLLDVWISIPAFVVVLSLVVAQTTHTVPHRVFSIVRFAAIVLMLLTRARIE